MDPNAPTPDEVALINLGLLGILAVLHIVLAIIVGFAASKMGARRGRLGEGLLDMGPTAWVICVLVFGPFAAWLWASVRPALHVANLVELGGGPLPVGGVPLTATAGGPTWPCPVCGRRNLGADRFCAADGAARP